LKILIVEDDINISEFLKQGLIEENYIVDCCFDGEEAFYLITTNKYDLVILDLMIPYIDGVSLCEDLRDINQNVPIIMLSAKSSIEDKVLGLNSGANDYLSKPFSFEELLARINVQLRKDNNQKNIYKIDNLVVDIDKKFVTRANKEISLSSKEYILLEYLVINKDKYISEDEINNVLWNMEEQTASNIIRVYIYRLRKKIDSDEYGVKLLHNVRGLGYKISSKQDD
jgi:DNA-binding response OmpR family regulator